LRERERESERERIFVPTLLKDNLEKRSHKKWSEQSGASVWSGGSEESERSEAGLVNGRKINHREQDSRREAWNNTPYYLSGTVFLIKAGVFPWFADAFATWSASCLSVFLVKIKFYTIGHRFCSAWATAIDR
jgi:hypothetical protein